MSYLPRPVRALPTKHPAACKLSADFKMHIFNIGTLIYTLINGVMVGTDEFGNRYYRARKDKLQGRERRWVLYRGKPEASRVPPEWHAWLPTPPTSRCPRKRPNRSRSKSNTWPTSP